METISPPEWAAEYQSVFQNIFRNTDPFDQPLREGVQRRALLYPVHFTLDRQQFDAVFATLRATGETELCASIVEDLDRPHAHNWARHWRIRQWEYSEYRELPRLGVLENALYSPSGLWGMLISHEQHAVAGGAEKAISVLLREFPNADQSLTQFARDWRNIYDKGKVDTDWVPALIRHVGGDEALWNA